MLHVGVVAMDAHVLEGGCIIVGLTMDTHSRRLSHQRCFIGIRRHVRPEREREGGLP